MKRSILFFLFFVPLVLTSRAQCNTYVQMISGVEGCLYPVVVSTQQLLLPCSAPAGFYELAAGDFVYIEFTPSSCISLCMSGTNVDITCFNSVVGMSDQKKENNITIHPNPATNNLTIEFLQRSTIEILNIQGQLIKTLQTTADKTSVDVSDLPRGVYIIKLNTADGSVVRKIIKE